MNTPNKTHSWSDVNLVSLQMYFILLRKHPSVPLFSLNSHCRYPLMILKECLHAHASERARLDTVSILMHVLRRQSCSESDPIPTSVSDPRPITQAEAINLRTSHLNSCSHTPGPQHGDTRITTPLSLSLALTHASVLCARVCARACVCRSDFLEIRFLFKIVCRIYIQHLMLVFNHMFAQTVLFLEDRGEISIGCEIA